MINFHNSVDIFNSYFIIIFITFIYYAIQVRAKARVRVEGMTCNRCVNFIQTKMKEVEGVVDIMVSLEQSEAMVTFDRGVLDSNKVAVAVDEVGSKFTASLVAEIVDIFVDGMTCQSCVRNIRTSLDDVDGVIHAEVNSKLKYFYRFVLGQSRREASSRRI